MPLRYGATESTRSANIREMVQNGHPQRQAIAAAYRQQRKAKRNRRK